MLFSAGFNSVFLTVILIVRIHRLDLIWDFIWQSLRPGLDLLCRDLWFDQVLSWLVLDLDLQFKKSKYISANISFQHLSVNSNHKSDYCWIYQCAPLRPATLHIQTICWFHHYILVSFNWVKKKPWNVQKQIAEDKTCFTPHPSVSLSLGCLVWQPQ